MTLHITAHAVQRYQERVAHIPDDEVRSILSAPRVEAATLFAGDAEIRVRLPQGHRIIIVNQTVVTVTPSSHYRTRRQRDHAE